MDKCNTAQAVYGGLPRDPFSGWFMYIVFDIFPILSNVVFADFSLKFS